MRETKIDSEGCEKEISLIFILEKISSEVVPILSDAASDALKSDNYMGLELAEILVKDAIRYDRAFPHARDGYNENILGHIENLRNRNGFQNGDGKLA